MRQVWFIVAIAVVGAPVGGCSSPRAGSTPDKAATSTGATEALPPLPELAADEENDDYRYAASDLHLTWPRDLPAAPARLAVYRIVDRRRCPGPRLCPADLVVLLNDGLRRVPRPAVDKEENDTLKRALAEAMLDNLRLKKSVGL